MHEHPSLTCIEAPAQRHLHHSHQWPHGSKQSCPLGLHQGPAVQVQGNDGHEGALPAKPLQGAQRNGQHARQASTHILHTETHGMGTHIQHTETHGTSTHILHTETHGTGTDKHTHGCLASHDYHM